MALLNYIRLLELISLRQTGNVATLANKLSVSQRTVKNMIHNLKEICDCPIGFDKIKMTYYYKKKGFCDFKFQPCKKVLLNQALDELVDKIFRD